MIDGGGTDLATAREGYMDGSLGLLTRDAAANRAESTFTRGPWFPVPMRGDLPPATTPWAKTYRIGWGSLCAACLVEGTQPSRMPVVGMPL